MRRGDLQPEPPRRIPQEPLGLAQRQPEHRPRAEPAEDRHVAVAPALAASRSPAADHRIVDPQRDRASCDQRAVVLAPVRDPVAGLRLRGGELGDALCHSKRESLSPRQGNPLISTASVQQRPNGGVISDTPGGGLNHSHSIIGPDP